MLWLYLSLSAAFSAGFMTCGLLTWRTREQERRAIQARLDALCALVQREIDEQTRELRQRMIRGNRFADPENARRHIVN